jgi:DNA polymerase III delta prime subunit
MIDFFLFDKKPLFNELDFQNNILKLIVNNISIDQLNNLCIYGMPGSGKSTNMYAFLATILDKNIYNLKKKTYENEGKTFIYYSSDYHIEFDPSFYGNNDKYFLSGYLKNYIQTNNILFDLPKIVYIKNADYLSVQSQMSLRRMIEKNCLTSRFIFECKQLNKIIVPLQSRFILIRNAMPKLIDIKNYLNKYIIDNNIEIDKYQLDKIMSNSIPTIQHYNMKNIFGIFMTSIYNNKITYFNFEYLNILNKLKLIILDKKLDFKKIDEIRDIIYNLYVYQINSIEIIQYIFLNIYHIYKSNNNLIEKILQITINCDLSIVKGNKSQIHLELYIVNLIILLNDNENDTILQNGVLSF